MSWDLPVEDSLQYCITLYSGWLILWPHWIIHTSSYQKTVESVRTKQNLSILFINVHVQIVTHSISACLFGIES